MLRIKKIKKRRKKLPHVQLVLDAAEEMTCADQCEEPAAKKHFKMRLELLGVAQLFDWTGFD